MEADEADRSSAHGTPGTVLERDAYSEAKRPVRQRLDDTIESLILHLLERRRLGVVGSDESISRENGLTVQHVEAGEDGTDGDSRGDQKVLRDLQVQNIDVRRPVVVGLADLELRDCVPVGVP